jgi:hypothetical protein
VTLRPEAREHRVIKSIRVSQLQWANDGTDLLGRITEGFYDTALNEAMMF